MAILVSLSAVAPGSTVAAQSEPFLVTVSNTGTAAVTINSLAVSADVGVVVDQPSYLTPNVAVGLGNPVLNGGASLSYVFNAIFFSPAAAGPSPQAPGGAAPSENAQTPDANFSLFAVVNTSDGSVVSGSLNVPVLSTIAPFQVPTGGALYLQQGFNLINLLTL